MGNRKSIITLAVPRLLKKREYSPEFKQAVNEYLSNIKKIKTTNEFLKLTENLKESIHKNLRETMPLQAPSTLPHFTEFSLMACISLSIPSLPLLMESSLALHSVYWVALLNSIYAPIPEHSKKELALFVLDFYEMVQSGCQEQNSPLSTFAKDKDV